jgi:hypothetical protein
VSKWEAHTREREVHHNRIVSLRLAFSTQHSALGIQPVKGAAEMKDFRDLQVWHKAHSLTLATYRVTSEFPKQEMYGLTSQMRRCAASIAPNIAEGCGKRGNGEF